jgi:hypothetical protein
MSVHLVSTQLLKFPSRKPFEIYTQGQEPQNYGQLNSVQSSKKIFLTCRVK